MDPGHICLPDMILNSSSVMSPTSHTTSNLYTIICQNLISGSLNTAVDVNGIELSEMVWAESKSRQITFYCSAKLCVKEKSNCE